MGVASTDNGVALPNPVGFRRVFRRQRIDASEAAKIVKQLFTNDSGFSVVPELRTNSLLASGSEESIGTLSDVMVTPDALSVSPQNSSEPDKPEGSPVPSESETSSRITLRLGKGGVMVA